MGIVIGIALTIAVMIAITWPFFRSKYKFKPGEERLSDTARLQLARADIYEQIEQLEADHDAAIISGNEYSAHLRELRISAAELIRAQESLPIELTTEDQLELEIEAARRSREQADSVQDSSVKPENPNDPDKPDGPDNGAGSDTGALI